MALTTKLARERIEKVLYYLCHAIGYDQDEFYEIKHIMTIQLLSDLAGISRETTGHIVHELKKKKLIKMAKLDGYKVVNKTQKPLIYEKRLY